MPDQPDKSTTSVDAALVHCIEELASIVAEMAWGTVNHGRAFGFLEQIKKLSARDLKGPVDGRST